MGQAIIHFIEDVIKGENDRTAIIVATAMIDMQLEDLLKSFLQPKRNQDDELFAHEGSLSTFSSKISLAFRLGILDPDLCAVLDGVRKVRNDFAHLSLHSRSHRRAHRGHRE